MDNFKDITGQWEFVLDTKAYAIVKFYFNQNSNLQGEFNSAYSFPQESGKLINIYFDFTFLVFEIENLGRFIAYRSEEENYWKLQFEDTRDLSDIAIGTRWVRGNLTKKYE